MKISDLTKAQQQQLDGAKEMVRVQQEALDDLRDSLIKLQKQEKIGKKDNLKIATHLRWTDEERQAFEAQDDEGRERTVERILAPPYAYFYVGHDKNGENPTHRVYVTSDGVEIQDEEHPDF